MKRATSALLAAVLGAALAASCGDDFAERRAASEQCLAEAGALFDRKIAPLLATDRPKTCNQCHLSGVDLNLFVRDDMCETRACLVELGLVNLNDPDESTVLGWIKRAKPESTLITQQVIDDEYEAFRGFVHQIAQCGPEACPGVHCPATHGDDGCGSAGDEPSAPVVVAPGTSCDALTVEAAFRDTVYIWRDRCFPCHFATEEGTVAAAPAWINNLNSCNAGSLETFHNVVTSGYVNLTDPKQSLILLKPLDDRDSGVTHGGGPKFNGEDDPSYVSFLSFINYWIGCGAPIP